MFKSIGKTFDKLRATRVVLHDSRTCPECGSLLAAQAGEDDVWHCPNLDCPARLRDRLAHWCSPEAMNIAGADKALIAQLVERGLARDVAELYSIKLAELAGLPGRDREFAKRLFEEIVASKSREGWRVLYGLGIPQVDAETAGELCRHFAAVDDILAAGPERLSKQAGVSEAIARSVAFWYGDSVNRRLVRRLQKVGVNLRTGR